MELAKTSSDLTPLKKTGRSMVIESFEKPKIYSLTDLEPLQLTLKYIFVMVGLRNIPSKEERAVLIDYIKDNYSIYSVEEIKIAFQLGLKREFECEMNHYEIFSCNYFGQVFDAYLKYRERIAKDYLADQERERNKPKEPTKEQILKLKKDFFNQVLMPLFENYKENKKLDFGYTPIRIVYESLRDDHKVINLTDEEKNTIEKSSKERFKDLKTDKLNKLLGGKKTPKERYFDLCQKKAIEKSFDKIEKLKFEL